MNSDYQLVLEKARKRFDVLKAIYTGGQKNKTSVLNKISEMTGIPPV